MKIDNNKNCNPNFGLKLGYDVTYHLKKADKLKQISQQLANLGEPTTVVEIMSSKTTKGKVYSLRLFNEIFGEQHNIAIFNDNHNKDAISFSPLDLLKRLEKVSPITIEQKEHGLFSKIAREYSGSLPMLKFLKNLIKQQKNDGKYLSPEIEQTYFKRFT